MENLSEIIIYDIINIVTVFSAKGRFEKINNRICYGLSFCIDGQITYTHKGKEYVSDKNHAIILPQGQSYSLHGDKKGVFPVINFKCANFLCDTITVLPIRNHEAYIKDFEQLKALFLFGGNHAKIMSIFYNIIHRLSSHINQQSNILLPAIKYIEKNYQNPHLSNEILAKECNISEIYFRKLFSAQFKLTPKQFIIDIRLQRAKQLLSEGILKINSIAEQCGFSNPYHFCRIFKERIGITPTEYMKQNIILKI